MIISQNSLVVKALKISKSILADEDLSLVLEEKKAYTDFSGSNGWVDKFKKRYKIVSRALTTKCTKNIEEIKISLESYFKDLNEKMQMLKKPIVYNMDEECIFF